MMMPAQRFGGYPTASFGMARPGLSQGFTQPAFGGRYAQPGMAGGFGMGSVANLPRMVQGGVQYSTASAQPARKFSLADQTKRFERAKKERNVRYLDMDAVYDGKKLAGKRVLITGANRGLGLATARQLIADGAHVICVGRREPEGLAELGATIVTGVDVVDEAAIAQMAADLTEPVDIVINNAGYFPDISEQILSNSLEFAEQLKQIDICALGPLRVSAALINAGKVAAGGRIIIISSQAGSAEWRTTQNAGRGGDYGHHMSRAACNIAGVLMSEELKAQNIPVVMLHPGFNRTEMTSKYSHIWDVEGAVETEVGAKRVLYEVLRVSMKSTGQFINCEDGLRIPF